MCRKRDLLSLISLLSHACKAVNKSPLVFCLFRNRTYVNASDSAMLVSNSMT